MSTLPVVEEILRETGVPMSVREIVERAGSRLPTKSKTPDTVVARDLSMDIKKKGESSIFARTAPGRYTMRAFVEGAARPAESARAQDGAGAGADAANVVMSSMPKERAAPIPAAKTPASTESPESVPASNR